MKVPLLDLAAQAASVEADVREAVLRVLDTQRYILGPDVEAFEQEMADFAAVPHAVAIGSGTDALIATLITSGIGPGDEVIVPAFTFFATAGCVARVGAKPVFVDVLPDTFNIDPDAVAAAITPNTRAILPVHLYGQMVDMTRLKAIAERHNLFILEDACQAIGATRGDRGIARDGHAAALSFYPTKNLSAVGEGGMVLTENEAFAQRLRCVRNHGQTGVYEHTIIGGNFRMDGIQGAALRVKLRKLPEWNRKRREHAAVYDQGLAGSAVTPPPVDDGCHHVYHQYTIRSARRDELRTHLTEQGIGCGIYYPLPLHLQPCFAYLGGKPGQLPVAEQACREVLSLPIFPEMSPEQQNYVIETICGFG